MLSTLASEILLIVFLTVLNGLFAMAELALISVRKAALKERANQGDKNAETALELASAPEIFLPTVQIGITLIGILAGVIGGATLAQEFGVYLNKLPLISGFGEEIALTGVVITITFLSIILGELAPKRIALGHAERLALIVARPLKALTRICEPFVAVLNRVTDALVRGLGLGDGQVTNMSEEEIRILLEQGAREGALEAEESRIMGRVLHLGEKKASSIMTPRKDIVFLDIDESEEEIISKINESPHSHFPVCQGNIDNLIGMLALKDLWRSAHNRERLDLPSLCRKPLLIPTTISGLRILERFRRTRFQVALVVDEHGGVDGLVTLNDLLQALVGRLPIAGEELEPEIVQRSDGTWLLDGGLAIQELRRILEVTELPGEERGFETLSGFVMSFLGRVPKISERFQWGGYEFEVVDMDGYRVDRVLVGRK